MNLEETKRKATSFGSKSSFGGNPLWEKHAHVRKAAYSLHAARQLHEFETKTTSPQRTLGNLDGPRMPLQNERSKNPRRKILSRAFFVLLLLFLLLAGRILPQKKNLGSSPMVRNEERTSRAHESAKEAMCCLKDLLVFRKHGAGTVAILTFWRYPSHFRPVEKLEAT